MPPYQWSCQQIEDYRKITAESWASFNQAESFADDAFDGWRLILPCRYWNRRKTFVDLLGGARVGVSRNEIPNFSDDFIFPLVVGTEIKESPTG
jgi:hypothetical protein